MRQCPFSKGVNFSMWMQGRKFGDVAFDRFCEQDFIDVKSLGADVIRLPIAFHSFTLGDAQHTLEPELFRYIETAALWAEKHKLYLIIDNHSFHPTNATPPDIDKILIPVWRQMAERFKNSSDYIIYEILNEPHYIEDELWAEIQGRTIDAIREIDSKHTLMVGGTNFNSIKKMLLLPSYKDANLIYTFHFYDPHIFTHQGATWNKPSLAPLEGLAFPFDKNKVPAPHETFIGTWVEESLNRYENDSKPETLSAELEKAAVFSKERGVPVFCGEFGVFMKQVPQNERVTWYEFICAELKRLNIPWTCWDYFGGFGLFKNETARDFNTELNIEVVKAMGFNK